MVCRFTSVKSSNTRPGHLHSLSGRRGGTLSPPPRKEHRSYFRSARRPVVTLSELLPFPNIKPSGKFKENHFTRSTCTETNITFIPQYTWGRAIQNQGIRVGNHQRHTQFSKFLHILRHLLEYGSVHGHRRANLQSDPSVHEPTYETVGHCKKVEDNARTKTLC